MVINAKKINQIDFADSARTTNLVDIEAEDRRRMAQKVKEISNQMCIEETKNDLKFKTMPVNRESTGGINLVTDD